MIGCKEAQSDGLWVSSWRRREKCGERERDRETEVRIIDLYLDSEREKRIKNEREKRPTKQRRTDESPSPKTQLLTREVCITAEVQNTQLTKKRQQESL